MRALLEYGWGTLLPYPLLILAWWWMSGWAQPLPFLAVASLGGLLLWAGFYRYYRHVADTPTASTRAAAQGYTECYGHAGAPAGQPLLTPYGHLPCLWYRAECRYQGRERRRQRSETQRSDDVFRLLDQHGEISVYPVGALVECRHRAQWREDEYLYIEHWIAAGDPLYVLGDMRSSGNSLQRDDYRQDLQLTLNQWKADPAYLRHRFDSNRDGQLSAEEWEVARQTAHQEVERMHRELAAAPASSQLQRPPDSRPFIISWREPRSIARRMQRLAWSHAAIATFAALTVVRHLAH
ncbi:hypothetical protein [Vogesella sp. LIG4]|uniref:hypothetical protein n=1 Tax=Vogesella sp. LIG4 TaxID=1192162 RepID=UPI00081FFB4E|nr:hypothetical protein [Vogesella sp. LIG4]SCK19482.1 hypothetical protein PSELUDRAFT_2138 [Vogesella sp. LIG4]